ncbi:MAG: DNA polymerase III subunit gamma/tau [Anaerolineaceae bacterium]|nr:MAG: DNA polymerase III subunit gamma/tau [Anaerolineaceae bacterium]
MSYMALYRKFRPDNFKDVKGQDHIVTTLRNQIKSGRIGHAYLFTGTRGTGKTTVAKLLAKTVNCENPHEGNPCNECSLCKGIISGTSMNVIEIDAASNNGVENVREIVEEVRYSPTEGRYKVYIIDEVHMLSAGAFNALLKTIEEPPSYVIFILATTEVHKIPVTILSRCQRYDFKRISIDIIADRLRELMNEEELEVEDKALRYIARMADGSLRDALSLLDQCISFYLGETVTYDNVLDVLGTVDTKVFSQLLQAVNNQAVSECIRILDEVETSGRELSQFVIDFIWYLRNLLLVKTTENVNDIIIDIATENLMLLKQEAESMDENILMRYIRIFSELSNQIRYAPRKRVLLEMALIKLCKPQMEHNYESLLNRIKILEDKLEKGIVVKSESVRSNQSEDEPEPIKQEEILPEALPEDLKKVASIWNNIIVQVTKKAPALGATLNNATLSIDNNKGLMIVVEDSFAKDHVDSEKNKKVINDTISKMLQKTVQINVRSIDKDKENMKDIVDLTKLVKVPIQYE